MIDYKNLLLSQGRNILTVQVNRPKSLNALSIDTIEELSSVFEAVAKNKEIAGVILTGAGEKAFVAGADIKEFTNLNVEQAKELAQRGQEVFSKIEKSEKPIIAAVNGFALGGGCEMAMACHFRIASNTARFGQPEINLGLIPGYGGTQRLSRHVGKGRAMELIMTGDIIDAEEAMKIGLVNHVVEPDKLLNFTTAILEKILTKAPIAIGMAIRSINSSNSTGDVGYSMEADSFANCFTTKDFQEGTAAFIEKRKPDFKGE